MAEEHVKYLLNRAREFAFELSTVLGAFIGESVGLTLSIKDGAVFVRKSRIPVKLTYGAKLAIEVMYRFELDVNGQFLKVAKSQVAVFQGTKTTGEPLFRYEYIHEQKNTLPCSHIHVHAHRDYFTRLMTLMYATRSKKRDWEKVTDGQATNLSAIHFPTGGHRFRPALEDVLQLIASEFGFEPSADWQSVVEESRVRWRKRQTASAVRDCPSEAVKALESMGYTVNAPDTGPRPDNQKRLSAY